MEQAFGIAAGVFTGISLLPQLLKMIKEKSSQDISLVMLICLLIGLVLWVVYGMMKKDWPIIITNSFSLLANCAILVLNYRYSRKRH